MHLQFQLIRRKHSTVLVLIILWFLGMILGALFSGFVSPSFAVQGLLIPESFCVRTCIVQLFPAFFSYCLVWIRFPWGIPFLCLIRSFFFSFSLAFFLRCLGPCGILYFCLLFSADLILLIPLWILWICFFRDPQWQAKKFMFLHCAFCFFAFFLQGAFVTPYYNYLLTSL